MTKAKPASTPAVPRNKPLAKDRPPQQSVLKQLQGKVFLCFQNVQGQVAGTMQFDMSASPQDLQQALSLALGGSEPQQYQFFYGTKEIKTQLFTFFKSIGQQPSESALPVVYHPVARFRVRPITRSSDSLFGHTESVLCVQFSPDSKLLASGSGDSTIRIWDLNTSTPLKTLQRHNAWVMVLAFRPDMMYLASGDADGNVICWDKDGLSTAKVACHKGPVMSISWQPLHLSAEPLLVSGGKDGVLKILAFPMGSVLLAFAGHLKPITRVLWGGQGRIFSSSEDQTVKCWERNGRLKLEYAKHGHWVNSFSLSSEAVIKSGGFDHSKRQFKGPEEMRAEAVQLYKRHCAGKEERIVTASDDFTLQLFQTSQRKPKAKLTGHQQPVNHVQFSPDSRFIVSCSFDKSLKLWDGYSGEFMANFRGHVGAIYMVAWSADSRYVVSGSKDSTMKVWDVRSRKLMFDLPGHADEVYALDWSRDGERVASGGKDRQVKIWRN